VIPRRAYLLLLLFPAFALLDIGAKWAMWALFG
jgi:hypothetical protein